MDFEVVTHPEHAVNHLQHAVQTGVPVMLPGALEAHRPDHAAEPLVPSGPMGPHAFPAGVDDRERLEREREGGGAPPGGTPGQRATVFEALQRSLLHLTERFIRLMATAPSTRQRA